MAGARGLLPRPADWKAASWLLERQWPLEYGDRRPVETEAIPAAPMPPVTLVLSMPDGKTKSVSFKRAEEILCADFTRSDEPPDDEGNGDGIDIGSRFNP